MANNKKTIQGKTTEKEVLVIVKELLTKEFQKNEKLSLGTADIYEMTLSYMRENNLLKPEDELKYENSNKTRLKSTVQNLISHKKLNKVFNIEKKDGKSVWQQKLSQPPLPGIVEEDEDVLESLSVSAITKEELEDVRRKWIKYIMVTSHSSEGMIKELIKEVNDEDLTSTINENGGLKPFLHKLTHGIAKLEVGKGLPDLKNFSEMSDLLMEAILSNKPVLVIRDYDNDGVSCQSAFDTLLDALEAMGVEHKVKVRQTHGGDIRGINPQDISYFKEMAKEYPGEDLAYLFTMDNGVSLGEEINWLYKEMGYSKRPKTGVIDHHTKDEDADLGDALHLNPELSPGDTVEPSAGGIVAALSVDIYLKYCNNNKITPKESIITHIQRLGVHANMVDLANAGRHNLAENATAEKKAGEIGSLMNVYIKYESLFRDENKLKEYLKQVIPGKADSIYRRFAVISEQAKIILASENENGALAQLELDYLLESVKNTELKVEHDPISSMRVLTTKNGYSTEKENLYRHAMGMALFGELKEIDKEISMELRKDKEKHILFEDMVDGMFIRIYNPESTAPTKAIDAAYPKPTTPYTISITPKVDEEGKISFARGGFRSTIEGGHSNFKHLNNEVLEILFKGHMNAAGAFVNTKKVNMKAFIKIMQTQLKAVAKVVREKEEEEGFKERIIRVNRGQEAIIPATSALNESVSSTLFPIDAGFDIALKGDHLNRLMKDEDGRRPFEAVPVEFSGSVFIVPSKKYNNDDYIVFNSLPDGSWITGGTVAPEYKLIDVKVVDETAEIVETKLDETYQAETPIYSHTLNHEDLRETIGVSAGVGNEDEGVKEAIGFVVNTMIRQSVKKAIVYDIETTGSTRGVNVSGERTDKSTKGKNASEVINGQFLIREIDGGEVLNLKTFKRREFYFAPGRSVLVNEKEYSRLMKEHEGDIVEKDGEKHIPKKFIKEHAYETIYSKEEKGGEMVYNHTLKTTTKDFLLKPEGEVPVSVVLLTHLNAVMLEKYGHDKKAINEGVRDLFKEILGDLGEDEMVSFAAHNIPFDLDMTPNTIPAMKEIEKNPRIIVEDTTKAVKEILKEYTSYGEFKMGDFSCYIQSFQNAQGNKDSLFTPAYVIEDFLAEKKVGYSMNLAEPGHRFEYRKNGNELELLYIGPKTEQVIIPDVTNIPQTELRGLVRYNVSKPTRYSMQLISNLAIINGMFFVELEKEIEMPEFLGGLFDEFKDDILTEVQKEFMADYKFTYSTHQNLLNLMEKQIEVNGEEKTVEGYLREKSIKKFINEFDTYTDKEKELFLGKRNFKTYVNTDTELTEFLFAEPAYVELEKKVDAEKETIKNSLYDFLVKNKDLAKLYELKILTYSILPYIENLEFPIENQEDVKEYEELVTNISGIERTTVSEIIKVINENAKKLGHSPFHKEPHLNIGNMSDTIMEAFLLPLFITLNVRDANKRNYLVAMQTLGTKKSRNGSNLKQDIEDIYSKEIGRALRLGVEKEDLVTANHKTYIMPQTDLLEEDYENIIADLEAKVWIDGMVESLNKKIEQANKKGGDISLNKDGSLKDGSQATAKELGELGELDTIKKKIKEGKELTDLGQLVFECYELSEMIKELKPYGEKLGDKINSDTRYKVVDTRKVSMLRKMNENIYDFLLFLTKSAFFPMEDRKQKNKYKKSINLSNGAELPQDPLFKEEVEMLEREFMKTIKTIPELMDLKFLKGYEKTEGQTKEEVMGWILRNFINNEYGKLLKEKGQIDQPKLKTFANPVKKILKEGIPSGILDLMKAKPNIADKKPRPE